MQRVCERYNTPGSGKVFYTRDSSEEVVGIADERIGLRLQNQEIRSINRTILMFKENWVKQTTESSNILFPSNGLFTGT